MPSRSEAAAKVHDAIVKLLLAYDSAPAKGKADISRALTGLYAEYAKLKGRPDLFGQPYSVLTAEMKKAAGALQKVADDRASLANALVTAGELLSTVMAVLALFP